MRIGDGVASINASRLDAVQLLSPASHVRRPSTDDLYRSLRSNWMHEQPQSRPRPGLLQPRLEFSATRAIEVLAQWKAASDTAQKRVCLLEYLRSREGEKLFGYLQHGWVCSEAGDVEKETRFLALGRAQKL